MKKLFIVSVVLLLSACGTFPSASEYWTINGKWPGYEQVQTDMMNCGFINAWNNVDMPHDEYIKAYLCMEQKGYLFNGKKTCDKSVYRDNPVCKNIK
ncbi:hypothetical protein ACOR62_06085 [Neisseria lisongii]|uniref:Lipoprotein n=1 Tax=Neisseria lisongii TaxID=2912188 RepID=A0AAW5AIF9_9NEIS|nr:hypothetical protein [Neisseria lisongii]MCF7528805.1 hypothetical protein [Neisseria lisongii]MCF7529663.1 hypothetical protein [Neisseria lisongii]